jgi:archaellum biogenesis protein FlaJ (TadC family)
VTEEREFGRTLELVKMYQDAFKHMMTFCSGALVVSAAVVSAFFPKPQGVIVLSASFFAFLLGVAAAMVGLLRAPDYLESNSAVARLRLRLWLWLTVVAAYLALVLFGGFAVANFASLP